MKKFVLMLFVWLYITSIAQATYTVVVLQEETTPTMTLDEFFSLEHQREHILNGIIQVGPFPVPIEYDYTMQERSRLYQLSQKYLVNDWENRLFLDQFVIQPYGFPIGMYNPIPEPATLFILGLGSICLLRNN